MASRRVQSSSTDIDADTNRTFAVGSLTKNGGTAQSVRFYRTSGLMKTAATTLLVALLVISTARWLYFLGKIGRALICRLKA
jgi:hypothetical protein